MTGGDFCPDPLWDDELTVNNSSPVLTSCFQDTVLTYIPSFFLILLAPIYLYKLKNTKKSYIPHTWLNISQTCLGCILALMCVAVMGYRLWQHQQEIPLFASTILAPACRFIAMVLCVTVVQFGRTKGMRSSGFLFLHWLLQLLGMSIIMYSHIRQLVMDGNMADHYMIAITVIVTTLVFVQLILAAFVDKPPVFSNIAVDPNVCPEQHVSFLSRLTFWWFTSLIVRGYRHTLEYSDLWSLNPQDTSRMVVPNFEKQWKLQLIKAQRAREKETDCNGIEDIQLQPLKQQTPPTKSQLPKLGLALIRTFGPMYLVGSGFKLIHDIMMFISPMLLKALIKFTHDPSLYSWQGYIYAVLMFIVAVLQSLVLHQYFHRCFVTGMRIRSSVISSVYQKSLKLSNAARRMSTVGEVVNLMSVDAQRFMELVTYLNMIWSAPFQMCVSLYFLWMTLGPSVLAGVAVMILLIPVNAVIAKKSKQLQMKQMKHKDGRIKLMNEVLNGIKVIKLYAWEIPFKEKILGIRDKELDTLKKAAYLHAASSFAWSVAPFLVSLVTFAVYVLSSPDNVLDAEKAFVSLALFNILRFPLSMLPMLIGNIVQAQVSLKRLQKFLTNEELDPTNVQVVSKLDCAISIRHGSFSWERNSENLKHTLNEYIIGNPEEYLCNKEILQLFDDASFKERVLCLVFDEVHTAISCINVEVPEGKLVAVVGQVGSGKSSLLAAMLGEMEREAGIVKIKGTVAYVAQQAWIQNATMKDNIQFMSQNQDKKLDTILDACALKPDLEILPGREMTEIGEKGINLSGGQKQRVALARAVYSDADIFLMDDPLSAVDSNVGKHIFEKVIGPKGMLQNKTRVLVTHGLSYLPECDQIVVLVDGRVSEVGTYAELLEQSGAFAEILRTYLGQDEDLETGEEENKDELVSPSSSIRLHQDTHKSSVNIQPRKRQDTVRSLSSIDIHSSCTSLANQDREIVERSIKEQERKEEENKIIEAEKAETGTVKLLVLKMYLSAVGVWVTVAIVLLFTLHNAAAVLSNFWLSAWADDVKAGESRGNDTAQRDMRLGVYGALGFTQALLELFSAFTISCAGVRASRVLYTHLVLSALRAPIAWYSMVPVGRILNRHSDDTATMDLVMPFTVRSIINVSLIALSTLIVLAVGLPWIMLLLPPVAIVYWLVQRFYVATSRQLKRIESVSRSPIYSHFGETIQGAMTIRAYRQQQRFIQNSESKVDENQVSYYPSIVANRWLAIRLEFVGNLIVLFSAVFAVAGRNHLTAGIVGLSISYALNITQTLNWMVRMTSELETNIVAVERVKEYSETPTEALWVVEESRPAALWPEEGRVDIDTYSTRYREGMDLVLKKLSAHIEGGEKIGIVGRTGAGKSSLALALFRIIESAGGYISIDGISIADIGLHDLRSKLTIIPQEPVLFSGSLRMNLDPFGEHKDNELWAALEHAHLKSFVSAQNEQLDYECTEGGENLSMGQRQLVCLARALLRKTRVLILDEATAAVDMETDDLIQATIRTKFADCTVITIAHRLNTIMDYTRILVLDQGSVVEFDSPKVLLSRKGIFYNMAKDAGLAE